MLSVWQITAIYDRKEYANPRMNNAILFNTNHPMRAAPLNKSIVVLPDILKIKELLKSAGRVLLKATTVFPFDFFPDQITIDECKVNIVFHSFFLSEDIHSIPIDMIRDIEVEAGPFFATLKIVPDGYPGQPLRIRLLKKKDAIRARKIIEGLIVAKRHGIDMTTLDDINLEENAELIGSTHLSE